MPSGSPFPSGGVRRSAVVPMGSAGSSCSIFCQTLRCSEDVAEARKQRESPSGRIRLIIPRTATKMVILPKLARFVRSYSEIVLEVTSSNDPVDLVAGGYDAGVQLGEFIQRDMIAVRVTKELRLAVVGPPEYFESHNIPRHPQDLRDHACIGFRFSSGLYRWEFEKGRKPLTASPQGPVSFDDPDLVIQGSARWSGNRNGDGGESQGPNCRRTADSGPERLVSIFSGIFSLLS